MESTNAKVILNVFYEPVESTRKLVEDNRDWFIPMHGGAADAVYSNEWMKENLIGDDTGDNISSHNRRINENSSIYWVWKNYSSKEVGNPDWIGFNHYRRYFTPKRLREVLSDMKPDMVVSPSVTLKASVRGQYAAHHYVADLSKLEIVLPKKDLSSFRSYLNQTTMFAPAYLFMMRREDFFEWCEYVFPVIFDLEDLIDTRGRNLYNQRAICFLVERLFGFFVWKKLSDGMKIVTLGPVFDMDAKSKSIVMHELRDKS